MKGVNAATWPVWETAMMWLVGSMRMRLMGVLWEGKGRMVSVLFKLG